MSALTTNYRVSGNDIATMLVPTGIISMFGGVTSKIPSGWLLCDGTTVSRTTYSVLFQIIGTTFGAGDGSTTFKLPNFSSNFPYGSSDSANNIGKTGGANTVTLDTNNLPSHYHYYDDYYQYNNYDNAFNNYSGGAARRAANDMGGTNIGRNTGASGGGNAFNILPPYLQINFIIKY
jgi:microcystin-dependent protein